MAKLHTKRRGIIAAKGITIMGGGMDLSTLSPRNAKRLAKKLAQEAKAKRKP